MTSDRSWLKMKASKEVYVQQIFSSIAKRYDFLNSLLSFNLDRSWRKFAVQLSTVSTDSRVLDVCTGTGELAGAYAEEIGQHASILSADFCFNMLAVGQEKFKKQDLSFFIPIEADTLNLPFQDDAFDIVSVGFGIRNISHLRKGISEMVRVAIPGGRVVILEFTQPTMPIIKHAYYFYFKKVLPLIGNLISKNRYDAYGYLPSSVMEFPDCDQLKMIMEKCGLVNVNYYLRTFGIVAVHVGNKR